jgi:hypothetical protein
MNGTHFTPNKTGLFRVFRINDAAKKINLQKFTHKKNIIEKLYRQSKPTVFLIVLWFLIIFD